MLKITEELIGCRVKIKEFEGLFVGYKTRPDNSQTYVYLLKDNGKISSHDIVESSIEIEKSDYFILKNKLRKRFLFGYKKEKEEKEEKLNRSDLLDID